MHEREVRGYRDVYPIVYSPHPNVISPITRLRAGKAS